MLTDPKPVFDPTLPYLEHYPEAGGWSYRLLLDRFPFLIGRSASAHYCINSRQVSKEHAEIVQAGEELRIRDLGSTNGTFVNGQRVVETPLFHGDIVHVAHKEFRFCHEVAAAEIDANALLTEYAASPLPFSIIQGGEHLQDLLRNERVQIVFQPIVDLKTQEPLGYESLGRGAHDKLSPNPTMLLGMAVQCDLAPELSCLFREVAVREAALLPDGAHVFINLHPSELRNEAQLNASLAGIPAALGGEKRAVVEFHEDSVADPASIRRFRDQLHALGIGLAYDDFGAGQARLSELAEVPPDFVKLDKSLTRGIHQAKARQELVQALTRVCTDLGIRVIAEGIESLEEAETCAALGCQFGQGFLFGRPQPVATFAPRKGQDTRRIDLNQVRGRFKLGSA
jgi:EAL domain-containing protein (putative c-di-GMP-specific phosphodiesterase class I)